MNSHRVGPTTNSSRSVRYSGIFGAASVALFGLLVLGDIVANNDLAVLMFIIIAALWAIASLIDLHSSNRQASDELVKSQEEGTIQRERIITMVNNLADAILSTDKDGVIRVYNAASLNLLDTNDSLNGHHIDEVLSLYTADNKKVAIQKELSTAKSTVTREDLHIRVDENENIRISLTHSPIRGNYRHAKQDSGHDGYIIIMRDITKAKSLEEERDEFISVVSHELRTPITIAEGTISNAQLIMSRADAKPEMLQAAMKNAHDQVIFLAKMVNDLSTLSRAERGVADEAEDIDVSEIINQLYRQYAPEAEAKGLHLNLHTEAQLGTIHASKLYFEELLQNFITNAIKYTRQGSIDIIVSVADGQVTFAVKDTGIGISKTDQHKIFEKFYRSEDYRTRETGGTGLGLYVAAKLSRKLDCKITLDSRLNHGSTFAFSLPQQQVK